MRLSKQYGNARLEAASARAVSVGARSYKHLAAILKNGLDRVAPLHGRLFVPGGEQDVAIVGHTAWQRLLGGPAGALVRRREVERTRRNLERLARMVGPSTEDAEPRGRLPVTRKSPYARESPSAGGG